MAGEHGLEGQEETCRPNVPIIAYWYNLSTVILSRLFAVGWPSRLEWVAGEWKSSERGGRKIEGLRLGHPKRNCEFIARKRGWQRVDGVVRGAYDARQALPRRHISGNIAKESVSARCVVRRAELG